MISKLLLTIMALFALNFAISQNAKLGVTNPSPRVGDLIEIAFTITDDSLQSLPDNVDTQTSLNIEHLGKGIISFKKIITRAGNYPIGPFTFTINGITYTSNKIILTVAPKLPETKEGVWVRQAQFENKDYLIIEQRIDLEKTKVKNPYNSFVELSDNIYDNNVISFSFISSLSPYQNFETERTSMEKANDKVIYKLLVYKINKLEGFKSGYLFTKKDLANFPRNLSFDDLLIR